MSQAASAPPVADDQQAVAAFLGDPASHGGQAVRRIDTHGSMVFLVGDRAYKVKRAVRFPYMDFGTLARRRAMCLAEVALNRRTAPQIYLGVAPVLARPDGALALGANGSRSRRAVEWVVVMHRFDEETLLDRLASRGALVPALMDELADAIAAFHGRAAKRRSRAGAASLREVADENLAELHELPDLFAPRLVAELARRTTSALDRLAPLLDQRAASGALRHCHGDLHLGNICLVDGHPVLFDGIEFNDDFSHIDVLYDIAFLVMDLDHRGLRPLANRLFNRYLQATDDYAGLPALGLFLSTRATVRAKVCASVAAVQPDPARAEAWRAEAHTCLEAALGYLEPTAPCLVAIGGLSGSGKSTLAAGIAASLGASPGALVLRSDVLRKRLAHRSPADPLPPESYSRPKSERVYRELARRAGAVLSAGGVAIADAVYGDPAQRADIAALAARHGVPFHGLWLTADEATLFKRVEGRHGDASDATSAVVRQQLADEVGAIEWPRLDANRGASDVASAARRVLGKHGAVETDE